MSDEVRKDRAALVAEILAELYAKELDELRELGVDLTDPQSVQRALDDEYIVTTLCSHMMRLEASLYAARGVATPTTTPIGPRLAQAIAESYASVATFELHWTEMQVLLALGVDVVDPDAVAAARLDATLMTKVRARMYRPHGILDRMRQRLGEAGAGIE